MNETSRPGLTMPNEEPSAVNVVVEAPDDTAAQEMMASITAMRGSASEWGPFHMLIAQAALGQEISLALPVAGEPYWHYQTLNDLMGAYVVG